VRHVGSSGQPLSIMAFTVQHGVVASIDALNDPERVAAVELPDS
jgi:hypothetical protein